MARKSTIISKLEKDECVCVVWTDARTRSDWMSESEMAELTLPEIKSLGFFHGIVNGGLYIKHNYCVSDKEADGTIIPFGWIKRIVRLKLNEKA